jgi:proteasome component ECM29
MKVLWQTLVKDPSTTLDTYFDAVIQELLKSILGREWRSREASCRAIADLIQDRKFDKYEKYLAEIWSSCSKVMDDIKGSVRKAGQSLARTLSSILVRNLEAGDSIRSTGAMLDHVLPFLLSPSGIEAKAEDVQGWAVSTLLLIIKKSRGKVLESHVPTLIESLISLFSSLEPAIVNYVHLNADKYNMSAQDIDDLRLKVTVKQSPLMEGVEKLLDSTYSNPATTDKVAAVVEKAARSSLGMPSLAATSRVIVTMFVRHQVRFKPYADRLLKAIEKPMVDRNETVSGSYAYASGYIARYATDEQIIKTANFAWKLWRVSENDRHRIVTAEIFQAISKHAPERFAALSDRLLPFVFVGKHDDQEEVKEIFQKTWSDSTSGPRVIILHLRAMVDLSVSLLDDPKWRLKHSGAKAIAEATEAVAGLDKLVSPAHAPTVWPALVKALAGKSWEGKEIVLRALAKFVEDVKPFWENDEQIRSEVTKIVLREARRQNKGYQRFSYPVLGRIATARSDLDLNGTVLEIVCPEVDELTADQDAMEVDGDDEKVKDGVRDEILSGAVFASQGSFGPLSLKSKGNVLYSA